ncbi:Na+/H+ antiporter [Planosporangium mesophilum]|uniref:Putative Na(+)/H(+) exchanger n=1 Tax=Planosporangium mesophilum TaxID=689768 RepID=A0A8J3X404_9ACTN|nr:Na+/H+ antiporter [Planosporangium mesophilum]NJC84483.1 Na+/H+ antiporter [Planosporangium mesophilum]GII23373.1 putative Na(+)/H(+) exchanger [Planosporangium mesophilum]
MPGLKLLIVLGLAVLVCGALSQWSGLALPVLLLACGVLLGFAPSLRDVGLPPEVMLLLFLPALLYWESLNTSVREIRANLRTIVPLSTVLVIVTAGTVATVTHALGLPWGPAWVLGAAVAPTDATAVSALARRLPRRLVTVIRAESLVNDGTALVIYSLAVSITVHQSRVGPFEVAWRFVLAYAGGVAAGLLTAWATLRVRRLLDAPLLENTVSLLTPFSAFLIAELVHASGVLAVVVCGLVLSQLGPRAIRADTRQQSFAFWRLSTFALNAALFVLVGLQLQVTARTLMPFIRPTAYAAVVVVPVLLIVIRFAWLYSVPYLTRLCGWCSGRRFDSIGLRPRMVIAAAGFRGAVSMAAALAVPERLASGAEFPGRRTIVFVTAGVIVFTLVVQGLALPLVVRWARLPEETEIDEELRAAEVAATEDALARMDGSGSDLGVDRSVVDRMRREYEKHLAVLRAHRHEDDDNPGRRAEQDFRKLRLALIGRKRDAVVKLRDEHRIDDTVLRQIQDQLDAEELRLSRRDLSE